MLFTIENLASLAADFAATHLNDYISDLNKRNRPHDSKEINDALWGTVSLTGVEVCILDLPLLQRLRYIKQLGVVHWIYPGAVHSRFEHSLGVVRQTQLLATHINTVAAQKSFNTLIKPRDLQILRMAALLHDVGHPAFSHVSEMAAEALPQLETLSADFSRKHIVERRSLSEIFAFYVVLSPAMRSFVSLLYDRYSSLLGADWKLRY